MKQSLKRRAFTMIELLFVIVVMGIVGTFAIEMVRQYYEGIYRTQTITQRTAEADHILEQVSKYFENAISASIVNLDEDAIGAGDCKIPDIADSAHDYTVAFIGVDADSLRGEWNATVGTYLPGWNEDVNISGTTMRGFGVNYNYASTITNALNGGGPLTNNSAVYNNSQNAVNNGGCSDYNLNDATIPLTDTKFLSITGFTPNTLTFGFNPNLDEGNKKRAYLLRSGYGFRVQSNGNFTMYTNFQPWNGERYNTHGTAQLLGQKVAHFYTDYNTTDFQNVQNLTDRGLVWRLKLCMRGIDANLSDSTNSANDICRERRVHVRY
jgi:prepilin-type N-terminal cleavage/methylation domain-containing protein